ncbi:MAG TPA: hypothetical protein PLP88_00765 [Bacteroidales bacterium]|nr:hypothetical protein [Bacteroidales bacterium]
MSKLKIVCLFVFITSRVFSQSAGYFPAIDKSDFPDARFTTPKTYNGSSLYGYMDGGADLYLEYGFSGAWIDEIVFKGSKHIIEIYRMNSAEEAFGIYSVSRYHCSSTPPIALYACQTPYQLQMVKGPFYVNIINTSPTAVDSLAALNVGKAIIAKISQGFADISGYLPGIPTETMNREAILVKGELGLRNGAPDLVDFFGDSTGYTALIMRSAGQIDISLKFETKDQLDKFLLNHPVIDESEANTATPRESFTIAAENRLMVKIQNK